MATFQDVIILKDKVSDALKKIEQNFKTTNKITDKATDKVKDFGNKGQKAANKVENALNKSKQETSSYSKAINNLKKTFLQVFAVQQIGRFAQSVVKLASDMQETINKVEVSFGDSTKTITDWASTSIKKMGLSQQSALDSAALYGDMATGMGFSQKKAAEMATSLTQLGADLASFKNISNDVAQTALKSIFTGETESLKGLGIVMTETNLQQFGLRNGMLKMVAADKKGRKMRVQQMKDLSQTEQVMLRYKYVMAMTTNAQGDFERTGGGAANQTRMFQENLKEIGTIIGSYLLPIYTKIVVKINEFAIAISNCFKGIQNDQSFEYIKQQWAELQDTVKDFAEKNPELTAFLNSIVEAFKKIGEWIIKSGIGNLIGSFIWLCKQLLNLTNLIAQGFGGLGKKIGNILGNILSIPAKLQTVFMNAVTNMIKMLMPLKQTMQEISSFSASSTMAKSNFPKFGQKTNNYNSYTYNSFSGDIRLSRNNPINGFLLDSAKNTI